MAGIKLEGFQGLIPRASKRLLPPMNATIARNCKLLNGEIRGYHSLKEDSDLTAQISGLARAYRVPTTTTDAWIAFTSRNVDVVRSPLVADSFDRYYWAGDGRPKMNTAARIEAGTAEFFLGVPTPTSAPGVAEGTGSDDTRSYVYTFVSSFGEEGPPSVATSLTGGSTATWTISGMDVTVDNSSNRDITLKNIYRTVTGETSTSFFFVAQVALTTAIFVDSISNETVAANNLLESTTYIEPETTMEGFIVMPNGYLVGWLGKRLLFSEPYRPHAWPAQYELSTEFDIIGLGVFGRTLVICTESQPYFGQGVTPASFIMSKVDAVEPCLSRRGIVSTTYGVIYPSNNGLVLANAGGVNVVTNDLFTKEEWATYLPASLYAAQLGAQYIAFNTTEFGFVFDPLNPMARFVELDIFTDIAGIETDRYSGDVLLLANDRVYNFDPESTTRLTWNWRSKVYQFPKPLNFGAARINFELGTSDNSDDVSTIYQPYNTLLFAAITTANSSWLNTLNGNVLGGSPAKGAGLVASPPLAEIRQPLGGSLLFPTTFLSFLSLSVRFIVKIRDKDVLDTIVTTESILRLPTGFKSDIWQFQMIGNTEVYSVQIAETPKQLAGI